MRYVSINKPDTISDAPSDEVEVEGEQDEAKTAVQSNAVG